MLSARDWRCMKVMEKWSVGQLQDIDPYDFERLLAQLFRKMGYAVEETQYSHDRGIDLIIRILHFGLSHSWIVQAKRYAEPVGVKIVREYSSLRYRDRVDGVIIVTTSGFTKEGQDEAAEHNVKLIDGNLLVEMMNHYIPKDAKEHNDIEIENEYVHDHDPLAILRRGEEIFAEEAVLLDQEKMLMLISNKNIFFRRPSGFFTGKSDIVLRIELKDLIGVHVEQQSFYLLVGQKQFRIYSLSSRRKDRILDQLDSIRPGYVRGEHILRSMKRGASMLVLTNKRLTFIDMDNSEQEDILLTKIVSVKANEGFFRAGRIVVFESQDEVSKHIFDVDDALSWKDAIEQQIRSK